ncbi:MAG: hypothetical protein ACYSU1_04405 [Planctomycetota bacterium]|jgi:hypothetical protein
MRTLAFSLAVSTALFASSPAALAQGAPPAGQAPSYTLGAETYNAMGASGPADFSGKPVLVEFWGTR